MKTSHVAIASRRAAAADVVIDVPSELALLEGETIFELRQEWRRLHQVAPPMRLSRDLLIRGILYKLQERALGGLSKSILRKLSQTDIEPATGKRSIVPPVALKPGTRLVREWHGVTYTVLIHEDGVEWKGQRYPSLSVVAREIMGARWSGPRFFGLKTREPSADKDTHADA
jgi:hypothetical protein